MVGDQPDVTAVTTIAAIGPALGHVGFTAERDRTGAAVASFYMYLRFVDEARHTARRP